MTDQRFDCAPRYILELTVFVCGAVVMIFELIGSRILGPYFGNSIFVWTSLIGVILGSLSLGYYFGGKMADKNPTTNKLSLIIFVAAIFIGLTTLSKDLLLFFLQLHLSDIRISSIISSIILFLPTSFLLGIISPYAAKLKINSLDNSGSTIGNLYALSTAGSIFGTFISGFYLIPTFGTNKLLIILTITLTLVSLSLSVKKNFKIKIGALVISALILGTINQLKLISEKNGFIDIDTAYSRIWIYDQTDKETHQKTRTLAINKDRNSAMILNSDELVFEYTKFYHLAKYFKPNFQTTLMLGGGGYSFPKNFLLSYPTATMDVVEIDPIITELAKKYFNLKEDSRLNIFAEDGRVFLNKNQKKYDVIFGDAFSSHYSIPYQLTTKEAVQKTYDSLSDDGVVILNTISSIEGQKGKFLRAELATYKSIFPQAYVFPVNTKDNGLELQNVILVAIKSKVVPDLKSNDPEINGYLSNIWKNNIDIDVPLLTDDYAPVEYYINKAS